MSYYRSLRAFFYGSLVVLSLLTASRLLAIKVLSYNVCWECMSNAKTGTAANLGEKCPFIAGKANLTVCGSNIAKQIDAISNDYGGLASPFDFVGLQESKNYRALKENSAALKDLSAVDGGFAVSFYNNKKYMAPKVVNSELEPGRPLQILIFKEGFIFVNLHAPHASSYKGLTLKKFLENKLSAILRNKITNAAEVAGLQNHRIIVVGDFNDHKSSLYDDDARKNYFVPFREAGIMTPVFLNSPAPWSPPITKDEMRSCCSTQIPYNSQNKQLRVSDYIFDSREKTPANFQSIRLKVPTNYDYKLPASDHLPIIYKTTEK